MQPDEARYLRGLQVASRAPWVRRTPPLRLRVVRFYVEHLRWPVFPCSINKRPLVSTGFHAATTDLDTVNRWWRNWPNALIGVATGAASGLVVVDVDRKGGRDGAQSICDAGYQLPPTWISRTRSGGLHFYYRWPNDDIRSGTAIRIFGNKLEAVDLRARGGYIIAPGPRDGYRWSTYRPGRCTISVLPNWLRDGLAWRPPPTPIPQFRSGENADRHLDDIVHRISAAAVGERNETLSIQSWRAGRLVAEGRLDHDFALAAVVAAAKSITGTDWSQTNAEATARRRFDVGVRGHG